MEDRKRPALGSADDMAPPSKRQATNGASKSSKDDDMKEEQWIEDYTKDAIYRQMLEYKRQCSTLETRLDEMQKRSTYYDDHIRIVDAWWIQLLQELQLLAEGTIPFRPGFDDQAFPKITSFKDIQELESHLSDKASHIKTMAESVFTRLASARGPVSPNITSLESQVNSLLASQKEFLVKLDRLTAERDEISDSLNTATFRYMKAERKMDRMKSTQVQKLEQQAMANPTARPATRSEAENGSGSESNANSEALQLALQEAKVDIEKQKEQLDEALSNAKSLQEELTACQVKLTSLTDEDYARTDVFKLFKSSQEDLIKKINHLEADNKRLKAATERLEKERFSYRKQLEDEAQSLTGELEDQLQQSDTNLARIRSGRDELYAEVTTLRAAKEAERTSLAQYKDAISANESRIQALEQELERLKPSEDVDMTPRPDIDSLSMDELREKYKKLEKDFESINKELPAMTAAVRKFQALANKKIADFTTLEERLQMAIAEKAKADQKYFGACKDTAAKTDDIKRLRLQNGKSGEIISQLKSDEAQSRTLLSSLEKQLMDLRQTNVSIMAESKKLESSSNDAIRRSEMLKAQVTDLHNLIKSKDGASSQATERSAALASENEKLKIRLDGASKERDKWKVKSMSNSSEEEEMLRKLAQCSVCATSWKDTVLKTCGHTFCKGCVENRIQNRMRKCPTCNKSFDRSDIQLIHL